MACNCGQRRLYNGYQYGNGSTCNNCGNNASYVNATNYWDSTGFDWLAAMQTTAYQKHCCNYNGYSNDYARQRYLADALGLLIALLHQD